MGLSKVRRIPRDHRDSVGHFESGLGVIAEV